MARTLSFDLFARDRASNAIDDVGRSVDGLGKTLDGADEHASAFGEGLGKLTGIAAGAVAGMAGLEKVGDLLGKAFDQEAATDRLGAALGKTPQEAKRYGRLASTLYAGAWGESLDDVSHSVEAVASSFPQLGQKQLKAATTDALNFAGIFEVDVPRAVQVAQTVVQSGLAKNASEAFDLLTRSAQKVPAALRENVLDAAEEYSGFFHTLGIDGPQAFQMLSNGAAQGQFGIDKVGDAVKEFTIRATDMSSSTKAAYQAIGVDAGEMARKILKGGDDASQATQKVVDGLLGIQNPAKRANAAIALFGTPLEDLNVRQIPDFLKSLQTSEGGLDHWRGSIKRAGDELNDNAATNIESFKRTLETNLVNYLGDKVVPAVDEFIHGWQKGTGVGGQFADAARDVGDGLSDIARVGGGALHTVDGLPDPLKAGALQAGLLALGVWKTVPALQSMTAKAATAKGALMGASGAMGRMRGVAGIAGIAAIGLGQLADSGGETQDALKDLANIGGGALLGFAVAGPVGGAVGGLAGAMQSLSAQNDDTAASFERNRAQADNFKDTLDQTTGAVTEQTRRQVILALQNRNLADDVGKAGLSMRDVISAVLGSKDAYDRVSVGLEKAKHGSAEMLNASSALEIALFNGQGLADEYGHKMRGLSDEFRHQQRQAREDADAVRTWGQELKGIPPEVKTKLRNEDYKLTRGQVMDLRKQYDLTPKQVATILKALGIPEARKGIKSAQDDADRFGASRPVAKLSTDGQQTVKATLGNLFGVLHAFDVATPTASLRADGRQANAVIDATGRNLRELDGSHATVTIEHRTVYTSAPGATHRAVGGRVEAGHTYEVGEFGRETFTPDVSGTIRSNAATKAVEKAAAPGGGATVLVDQRIDVQIVSRGDGDADADAILRALRKKRRELGGVPLGLS